MEYRHKIMRSTIGALINRAMRDITCDPHRSIRNLADLGEEFSKTQVQKDFFEMISEILQEPENPYNSLLVKMIQDVSAETVKTTSLNFGYTSLNYGAEILRQESRKGVKIPWLVVFDCGTCSEAPFDLLKIDTIISDTKLLGIYTYVIQTDHTPQKLAELSALCKRHAECTFFAALSPEAAAHAELFSAAANLIPVVDVTGCEEGDACDPVLRILHEQKCLYGFYACYNKQNADWLMSDRFAQQMLDAGCLFGGYLNADKTEAALEDELYRYVCTRRGKNGQPPFVFDFYRDAAYIGNMISCGDYLLTDADGRNLLNLIRKPRQLHSS